LVIYFRRVKRGQWLYRAGDPFQNIYAVRSGSFKTTISDNNGREQITGFQMSRDVLGLDGISSEKHIYNVIALEDSELRIIPFSYLENLCRESKAIQRYFYEIMSAEIVRESRLLLLLGNMCAEERLATFLLNFSQQLKSRGYAYSEFQLRASREEIGSYLGMKLETVSRIFSKFQKDGFITTQQKQVHILDSNGLKAIVADTIVNPTFPIEVF
jgi:CRP/FNR family transcriptional regulator